MQFDTLKNPGACCAKEATRYAAQGAALVKHEDRHYLAATDGRVLSMIAAEVDPTDTVGTAFPVAAFDAARKNAQKHGLPNATLELNGKASAPCLDGSRQEWPALESRFPDVVGVLPNGKPSQVVQLNAEYLATVQRALGAQALRIEIHDDSSPVRLVPLYVDSKTAGGKLKPCKTQRDGSFAVLMPISN